MEAADKLARSTDPDVLAYGVRAKYAHNFSMSPLNSAHSTDAHHTAWPRTAPRTGLAAWLSTALGSALLLLGLGACTDEAVSPAPVEPKGWVPGNHLASDRKGAPRDMLDVRGLIHAHSVYSHDACDGDPRDENDAINMPCLEDFRRDLCRAKVDFIMLTDHNESYSRTDYPDTLLYYPDRGDELVERMGAPVASWAACEDGGEPALILAGTESGTMPVGLERHATGTEQERRDLYGEVSAEAIATHKQNGGVVLAQHTEDWSPEQLIDLGFDGFEMFNLHANAVTGADEVLSLLLKQSTPEEIPASDLVLLAFLHEDDRYLERWGSVLSRDTKMVTTIGTDCHRNSFPQIMPDGERVDSYRRMMIWMSNHLLIRPRADGTWDDSHLKDALSSGRLYGVFEVMGYAEGFDYRAATAGNVAEMGEEVLLADGVTLVASMPRVRELDPDGPQPELSMQLLRAEEGGWSLVASSETDLEHEVTQAGAYRVEVRMKPRHLTSYLASYVDRADRDTVWIYSNAIYVR